MRKRIKTLFVICCALCMLATGLTACKSNQKHTHTLVKTEATSAECTVDGNNAYWTCSDCGKVYSDEAATKETTVDAQKIPAKGHSWEDPTCTDPKTCSDCGTTEGNALGHTPEIDDGNCTTAQKCTVCGQTAVDAKAEHTDADGDFLCDNCQVTVGNIPEDKNEGIDLPIDKNNG